MRVLAALVLLLSLASAALADAPKPAPETSKPAPSTQPVNKYCLVQGPPNVCDMNVTYVYEGKTYGFCCPDCVETFKKDPAKYVANAK